MEKDDCGLQTQAGCSGAVFPTTRMTEIEGEPKAQSELFSSSELGLASTFEIICRNERNVETGAELQGAVAPGCSVACVYEAVMAYFSSDPATGRVFSAL